MSKWHPENAKRDRLISEDSIAHKYYPTSPQGEFIRPPRKSGCILDYMIALALHSDGGRLAHEEMELLISNPDQFFSNADA